MPGYADWKTLYREELFQMREEGYDLTDAPQMSVDGEELLPFPGMTNDPNRADAVWESAYRKLEELKMHPLRADFPYCEPNDFEEILKAASPMPNLVPLSDAYHRSDDEADLERLVLADEKHRAVNSAVAILPRDMRDAVHLVYFEEMTYKEAAKVMKKNVKQVDNLLQRAKKELHTILREDGELL